MTREVCTVRCLFKIKTNSNNSNKKIILAEQQQCLPISINRLLFFWICIVKQMILLVTFTIRMLLLFTCVILVRPCNIIIACTHNCYSSVFVWWKILMSSLYRDLRCTYPIGNDHVLTMLWTHITAGLEGTWHRNIVDWSRWELMHWPGWVIITIANTVVICIKCTFSSSLYWDHC